MADAQRAESEPAEIISVDGRTLALSQPPAPSPKGGTILVYTVVSDGTARSASCTINYDIKNPTIAYLPGDPDPLVLAQTIVTPSNCGTINATSHLQKTGPVGGWITTVSGSNSGSSQFQINNLQGCNGSSPHFWRNLQVDTGGSEVSSVNCAP
jgi:hypothetical protein